MPNRYDNHVEAEGASVALNKINGSMDSSIGHNHSTNLGNGNSSIPGSSISGTVANADTVDNAHAGTEANNVLKLDSSGLIPLANIPTTLTGKNAATATLAEAAKGDNRFQLNGLIENTTTITAFQTTLFQTIGILVPTGKTLKLKRWRFKINYTGTGVPHLKVDCSTNSVSSTDTINDESMNYTMATGNNSVVELNIKISNSSAFDSITINRGTGWWIDLAIE